jgi:dTDP-4-dehydrorhamnose reductase
MKKVLILGAEGMLGQELVRSFGEGGFVVTGWDRGDIDVTDTESAREKISALAPDVIINAVAYNAVDACEEDETEQAKAWRLNAEVPGELARIASDLDAAFVHYSTDYVFDGEQTEDGYAEDAEPNPLSYYGKSKRGGEEAVIEVGGQYFVIRLAKLFGKPAVSAGAKESFFAKMEQMARAKGDISVVDDERGNFTYAPDLADATRALVLDESDPGIYHLVNEGSVTWYDALVVYFRLAGVDTEVRPVSGSTFLRPARRPKNSTLINTKRPPLRDLGSALRDFAERER